jgi:hypothetical protein
MIDCFDLVVGAISIAYVPESTCATQGGIVSCLYDFITLIEFLHEHTTQTPPPRDFAPRGCVDGDARGDRVQ